MLRSPAYLLLLETPFFKNRSYHAPANKLAREGNSKQATGQPVKEMPYFERYWFV